MTNPFHYPIMKYFQKHFENMLNVCVFLNDSWINHYQSPGCFQISSLYWALISVFVAG